MIRLGSKWAQLAGPRMAQQAAMARGYAKKSADKNQPQSLLNDDLLEKAGMDLSAADRPKATDAAAEDAAANGAAEAKEDAEGASGDSQHKWANTARKPREETSTIEKRTKRGYLSMILMGGAALAFGLYSARPFDDDEAKRNPELNAQGMDPAALWQRASARATGSLNYFSDPAFEKLLPDALPAPYGRPLTLVLALDDLLVKSEWSREHGWRTAKRPGLDYFLVYLAQYYEIVIFSDKYQVFDEEVVAKLDPYRAAISYSLFREASRFQNGKIVKDLSHLNRDLSKTILVDISDDAVALQPANALVLPRWKGNPDDQDLVRLIPLLEWIGAQPVKDVRPILDTFKTEENGVIEEFERREAIARDNWRRTSNRLSGSGAGWASSFLGASKKSDPNMMPQDYVRAEGQRGYAQFQKLIEEQGQKMLEEEKQREKEIMERHKMTLNRYMTQGGPTPEEIQATMADMEREARVTAEAQDAARHEKL